MVINRCRFNRRVVQECYGDETLRTLGPRVIVSSGAAMGTRVRPPTLPSSPMPRHHHHHCIAVCVVGRDVGVGAPHDVGAAGGAGTHGGDTVHQRRHRYAPYLSPQAHPLPAVTMRLFFLSTQTMASFRSWRTAKSCGTS